MSHTHEHHHHHEHHHKHGSWLIPARIIITVVCAIALHFIPIDGWSRFAAYFVLYLFIGYDILKEAIKGILRGEVFDENFLMVVATAGAFALAIYEGSGDYMEAIMVMLLFQIGEYFQGYAVSKSHRDITALMNISQDDANIKVDGIHTRLFGKSAFITRLAHVYTPIVCYSALALAVLPTLFCAIVLGQPWGETVSVWLYRALTILVISCPCALVISIPLTFFAGIGGASKAGIFVKGSCCLELLSKVKTVVFDKTDTLTEGVSAQIIQAMHNVGVTRTIMLTGDAELLPDDKIEKVEQLLSQQGKDEYLAFVGGGINDVPVLHRADIGIAMGALGCDAAIEAADVVLMDNDPMKISTAVRISRHTLNIVWQNIIFAIGIKVLCLILSAFGITNMWLAIFADVGVMILSVLNAMRAMRVKKI